MRTDAKVVHLNKAAPEHKPASPAGRLPVALISGRDKAVLEETYLALTSEESDVSMQRQIQQG